MPDVGILNLQIHDNSEQAGRGLNQFADALVRVQAAVGKGLQMGNVSRSLKSFATAVSENSRSLSNAGTFLNAITAYTKAFKNTEKLKFNSEPIDKLKAAIGDGIKIGQAGTQINKIREAFAGDWGSGGGTGAAITAMSGLANVAVQLAQANAPKVITDMAKAIGKYAEAQSKMPAGAADSIFTHVFPPNEVREASKQAESGIVDYMDAVKNFESAQKVTFREPSMKLNLQQFGGKGSGGGSIADAAVRIEEAIRGANAEAGKLAENFKSVSQALQETLKVADEINKRAKGATDSVTKGIRESNTGPSEDLLLTLDEGASKLDLLSLKLGILSQELNQGIKSNKFDDKKVINYSLRMEELEERIRKLLAIERQAEKADFLTEFAETYSTVEAYSMKASALEAKLRAGIQSGTYDDEKIANTLLRIYNIKMKIQALEDEGSRSDAMLVSDEAARDAADKYLEIHDNVDRLKTEIDVLKEKMGRGIISGTADESQLIKWAKQLDSMTERYEKLLSAKETVEESALPDEYVDSLDNTVEKLEDASDVVDEIKQKLSLDDTNGISQHITELDYLYAKLRDAKQVFNDYANTLGLSDTKTIKAGLEVSRLKEKIDELKQSMDGASRGGLFSGGSDFVNSLDVSEEARNSINGAIESVQGLEELREAANNAGDESKELTGDLGNLDKELKQKKTDSEEASGGLHKFRDACEAAKKGLKNMFPFLERVRNQFSRILLRRAIMAVLRSISEGFKEGVENVYRYSQAVGTSFAPAMDSAASKLLQMKNSIGAAVAPIIEALIPVLRQVVDWFINLVNYANQFFALMTGQKSWTRALETGAKAYDDVKESAKGASKATKDLLADWDELNIIQSEGGGGGTGSSGKVIPNYTEMFEQVSDFDDGLKKTVEFLKDNFDSILTTAGLIGTAILGWKINSAFGGVLGTLGTIAGTAITVALSLILTDFFGKAYIKTGEPGWFIADALTGAVGAGLAGKIASKLVGTSGGIVTAGFTLILEGAINIKNAVSAMQELREGEAWALITLGSVQAGVGAALSTYGLTASAGAAALMGGVFTAAALMIMVPILMKAKEEAEYRKMARDAFVNAGNGGISIEKFVEELQAVVDEKTAGAKKVIEVSVSLKVKNAELGDSVKNIARMHELIRPGKGLTEEEAKEFKKAWDIVIGTFTDLEHLHFDVIYKGLEEVIRNGSKEIREAAIQYRRDAIEAAAIMEGAEGKMKARMAYLNDMIVTGNATPAEMAEYERYYTQMHPADSATASALDDYYASFVNGFDLSDKEDPVGSVRELIDVLSGKAEGPVSQAMTTYREALDAELESINGLRENLEFYYREGLIGETEYNAAMGTYDRLEEVFKKRYEEQIAGIADMTNDAYAMIMEQALAGLRDPSILSDSKAMQMYFTDVFDPIMTALEEVGYEIPEWYKNIREGIKKGTIALNSDLTTFDNQISRHDLFSMIFDLYDNPIPVAIAFEIDRNSTRLEPMSDSEKTDIVQNLLEASGFDAEVVSQLSEAFGWSTLDILKRVDFSRASAEQLETFVGDMLYGTSYNDLIDQVVLRWRELNMNPLEGYGADAIGAPGRGRFVDPSRVMGFNGYSSGVNFVPSSNMGANETVETEDKAMVEAQNRQIAQISNVLVPLLQQILQKPLTVNLAPSSDWGQFNDRSYDRFSKVNGNP